MPKFRSVFLRFVFAAAFCFAGSCTSAHDERLGVPAANAVVASPVSIQHARELRFNEAAAILPGYPTAVTLLAQPGFAVTQIPVHFAYELRSESTWAGTQRNDQGQAYTTRAASIPVSAPRWQNYAVVVGQPLQSTSMQLSAATTFHVMNTPVLRLAESGVNLSSLNAIPAYIIAQPAFSYGARNHGAINLSAMNPGAAASSEFIVDTHYSGSVPAASGVGNLLSLTPANNRASGYLHTAIGLQPTLGLQPAIGSAAGFDGRNFGGSGFVVSENAAMNAVPINPGLAGTTSGTAASGQFVAGVMVPAMAFVPLPGAYVPNSVISPGTTTAGEIVAGAGAGAGSYVMFPGKAGQTFGTGAAFGGAVSGFRNPGPSNSASGRVSNVSPFATPGNTTTGPGSFINRGNDPFGPTQAAIGTTTSRSDPFASAPGGFAFGQSATGVFGSGRSGGGSIGLMSSTGPATGTAGRTAFGQSGSTPTTGPTSNGSPFGGQTGSGIGGSFGAAGGFSGPANGSAQARTFSANGNPGSQIAQGNAARSQAGIGTPSNADSSMPWSVLPGDPGYGSSSIGGGNGGGTPGGNSGGIGGSPSGFAGPAGQGRSFGGSGGGGGGMADGGGGGGGVTDPAPIDTPTTSNTDPIQVATLPPAFAPTPSMPSSPTSPDNSGSGSGNGSSSSQNSNPGPGNLPPQPDPGPTYTPPQPDPGPTYTPPQPDPGPTYTPPQPDPGPTYTPPQPDPGPTYTPPQPDPDNSPPGGVFTDPNVPVCEVPDMVPSPPEENPTYDPGTQPSEDGGDTPVVPEPTTLLLLTVGSGLGGLRYLRRRRKEALQATA